MFYRAPYFGMPRLIGAATGEDPLGKVVSRLCEAAEPGLAGWAAGLASPSPETDVLRAILGSSPYLVAGGRRGAGVFPRTDGRRAGFGILARYSPHQG